MTELAEPRAAISTAAEDRFVELFAEAFGVEKVLLLSPEHPVQDIYGATRFVDFAIRTPAQRVAFEIDGLVWHHPEAISRISRAKRWEHTGLDEQPPVLNAVRCVNAEDLDCCPPDGRLAHQPRAMPAEMFAPLVCSWIEERNQAIRQRIVTCRVRSLPRVAGQTRQR